MFPVRNESLTESAFGWNTRRVKPTTLFKAIALSLFLFAAGTLQAAKPNFVIIFTDDQGYGDLSCFGSKTIKTPNIDRIA